MGKSLQQNNSIRRKVSGSVCCSWSCWHLAGVSRDTHIFHLRKCDISRNNANHGIANQRFKNKMQYQESKCNAVCIKRASLRKREQNRNTSCLRGRLHTQVIAESSCCKRIPFEMQKFCGMAFQRFKDPEGQQKWLSCKPYEPWLSIHYIQGKRLGLSWRSAVSKPSCTPGGPSKNISSQRNVKAEFCESGYQPDSKEQWLWKNWYASMKPTAKTHSAQEEHSIQHYHNMIG